jgi:hypothetical protein
MGGTLMDPFTAALQLVKAIIDARREFWQAIPEAERAALAQKYAASELRWLDFLESLRPKGNG